MPIREKRMLSHMLGDYKCVAVAYSGGMDSSVLLSLLKGIGKEIIAITVYFPYIPRRAIWRSEEFTRALKVPHIILVDNEIMESEEIARNGLNRCYVCKERMMRLIKTVAKEKGCDIIVDGTNLDDLSETRPGLRALKELGIMSPFAALKIGKERIRELAKELGISELPPDTCLLTRLPYDFQVKEDLLRRLDLAEEFIMKAGISLVRARYFHGGLKIEVLPSDMSKLLKDDIRRSLVNELSDLGFNPIMLDLRGYVRSK